MTGLGDSNSGLGSRSTECLLSLGSSLCSTFFVTRGTGGGLVSRSLILLSPFSCLDIPSSACVLANALCCSALPVHSSLCSTFFVTGGTRGGLVSCSGAPWSPFSCLNIPSSACVLANALCCSALPVRSSLCSAFFVTRGTRGGPVFCSRTPLSPFNCMDILSSACVLAYVLCCSAPSV